MSRRFVLLDRDGTLNEETAHYVLDTAELRLLPGAAVAVRRLREAGLGVVVITNQSPVGRGWITAERLAEIHARLEDLLGAEGAELDGVFACLHGPDEGCRCRKPEPGLALEAAEALGFDLTQAFVVGDHTKDLLVGRRVGARTILVRTGQGAAHEADAAALADVVVADLAEAAEVIRAEVLEGAEP